MAVAGVVGRAQHIESFGWTNVVVSFSPATAGAFSTDVIFASNGGNSTNSVSGTGAIVPVASFTASQTNGISPLTVTFTDTSAGTISNRFWNFGDNTTSNTTATTLSHPFALPGVYTVQLIVTGPLGTSTNTQNNLIAALSPPQMTVMPANYSFGTIATGTTLQTSFTVTNTGQSVLTGSATAGGAFTVTNGNPFSVAANSATNVLVSFTPTSVGDFATNVIFTSNGGDSTNPVSGAGAVVPVAAFTATPTNGTTPLAVVFTDLSTGTITNRFWDFGDGTTTNTLLTALGHTYNVTGTNAVVLIVTGPLGTSTNRAPNLIVVHLVDSVGDGIPDAWRAQFFGDGTTTNAQSCASYDADGTGQNNLLKYVAGLDPTNPASVFVLSVVGVTNLPTVYSLTFSPAADGRTYAPWFSTNLVSGDWMPLTDFTGPSTNLDRISITDTNAVEQQKFYRINISVP